MTEGTFVSKECVHFSAVRLLETGMGKINPDYLPIFIQSL